MTKSGRLYWHNTESGVGSGRCAQLSPDSRTAGTSPRGAPSASGQARTKIIFRETKHLRNDVGKTASFLTDDPSLWNQYWQVDNDSREILIAILTWGMLSDNAGAVLVQWPLSMGGVWRYVTTCTWRVTEADPHHVLLQTAHIQTLETGPAEVGH